MAGLNSVEHLPAVPLYLGSLPQVQFAVSPSGSAGCWRKSDSSFSNHPSREGADRGCAAPKPPSVGLPLQSRACSALTSLRNTDMGRGGVCVCVMGCGSGGHPGCYPARAKWQWNTSTHSKPQHHYEAMRIFRWKMKALIALVINS